VVAALEALSDRHPGVHDAVASDHRVRTDCTQFWEFIGAMWRSIEEHVFIPWRQCKFWYCYLGLVLLFIVLVHIVIVLTILVWAIAFLCETLCILQLITTRRGGTCLVFSASPPPANLAPSANAGGPYAGRVGAPVPMTAAASTDPEGGTLTASWSFGDGGMGSGLAVSHTYGEVGIFGVTVTVSDGTKTATATTTATIVGIGGGPLEPPIDTDH
jgi:hypothetical protein